MGPQLETPARERELFDRDALFKRLKSQLGDLKQKLTKGEASSQTMATDISKKTAGISQLENQLRLSESEKSQQGAKAERLKDEV
jgi:septal ring factor EnvC (AmiA/AmiB activator)